MTIKKSEEGSEGEGNTESGDELTPEQIEQKARDKQLADEAKKYRLKLRDAEKERDTYRTKAEELEREREAGSATGSAAASEAATLKREIAELRKKDKERAEREAALEEKTRTKTITSTLASIVGKLNDPASAVELLQRKAKLAADDTVVFMVKDDTGEMVEKEATLENIQALKLLPEIYFPPKGVPGSGGRGGDVRLGSGQKGVVVDLERAKVDLKYYEDNKPAILAARAAQRQAS